MKNIPLALRQAKNQLGADSPWLILIDVALVNGPTFNLALNNEDIVFQGRTYSAFNFSVTFPKESSKGQVAPIKLTVSNVMRLIQEQIEKPEVNGGVGSAVTLYIVNAGLLSQDYSELTMELEVLGAECDAMWVTFNLGLPNPLRRRFPLYRYLATSCRWQFKSAECAYVGADSSCARTFGACQQKNNVARFGGEPGLAGGGLRLV